MQAIPFIALGISAVGTGLSAVSQYQQGQTAAAAYEYNAKVAEAEGRARKQKAGLEEEQSREKLKRILGTQRALYAKAGVDITSGSPLLTMMDTAMEGEKEAQLIRYGGEVEEAQAINQARLQRMYGAGARRAGTVGGVSTFFTGLGQAGTQYARIKKGGPF